MAARNVLEASTSSQGWREDNAVKPRDVGSTETKEDSQAINWIFFPLLDTKQYTCHYRQPEASDLEKVHNRHQANLLHCICDKLFSVNVHCVFICVVVVVYYFIVLRRVPSLGERQRYNEIKYK